MVISVLKFNNIIKKCFESKSIKMEELEEYNIKEIYNIKAEISKEQLKEVIVKKVWGGKQYKGIISMVNDCQGFFNMDRYEKYLEFRKLNKSDSSSKKFFLLKYGEDLGLKKFKEKSFRASHSLDAYIYRHGEKEGKVKYEESSKRNAGNLTLERKIKNLGEEEGKKAYKKMKERQSLTNTLEKFVLMYGENEGLKRYNLKNKKNSESSKKFAKKVGSKYFDKRSDEFCKKYYGVNWKSKKKEITQKTQETNLNLYGNIMYINSKEGKEKAINTSLEKYGFEHPMQNQAVKDKKLKTNLKKYGASMYIASEEGKKQVRKTLEEKGLWIPQALLSEYELYSRKVWDITKLQNLEKLPNINKRANLAHTKDAWHLDHKISIRYGFINNISVENVGSLANLQMLPGRENCSKGSNCYSAINR